jgi:fatty acid desaturase
MVMRNPVNWLRSHAHHHTDTIITEHYAEIACKRPPDLSRLLLGYNGLHDRVTSAQTLIRHASGRLSDAEKGCILASAWPKAIWAVRLHMAVCIAVYCVPDGTPFATDGL